MTFIFKVSVLYTLENIASTNVPTQKGANYEYKFKVSATSNTQKQTIRVYISVLLYSQKIEYRMISDLSEKFEKKLKIC